MTRHSSATPTIETVIRNSLVALTSVIAGGWPADLDARASATISQKIDRCIYLYDKLLYG